MTLETYENLMRVFYNRIRSARNHGDWDAMRDAIAAKQNLIESFRKENEKEQK
jgi:hypothetical protein